VTEPISSPEYWRQRLELARAGHLHHAIFKTPLANWQAIEAKHRTILARTIQPTDSVLDAGCGWGRLLTLMPETWKGRYLGVDLSPDFIKLARQAHFHRSFVVGDLRSLNFIPDGEVYDFAILISIRPMVRRNMGDDAWQQMEAELRRVAKKLLFLEYDSADDGEIA